MGRLGINNLFYKNTKPETGKNLKCNQYIVYLLSDNLF